MASLARTNRYLRKQSVLKAVKENASTSSAFEGVRAADRGGAFHYKLSRSKIASSKKSAKASKR
jgi:hypothetical protein